MEYQKGCYTPSLYILFYDIRSRTFKSFFGAEDKKTGNRIVRARLKELEVPIYQGRYVIMDEVILAIKGDGTSYNAPLGESAKKFMDNYEAT